MKKNFALALFLLFGFILAACEESNNTTNPPATNPAKSVLVKDLPADPEKSGHYTFFSLKDSSIVALADSNTTKWDIAFNATTIIVNSGVRGPGQGGAILLEGQDYNALKEAPTDGYRTETTLTDLAIPKSKWYSYNPTTHVISVVPGVVIMIRTADGKYAKLQMLHYYKGAPDVIDPAQGDRYLTFKYVYQPDGSRKFE